MIGRGSLLSNGWLVSGGSVAAIALLVFLLWAMGSRPSVTGKSLHLFCAAGISKPVRKIIQEYERAYGVTIQADYGATGELLASIAKVGVQGDLFISADSATMRDAQRMGIVAESIPIARIRTVLVINRKTQERLTKQGKAVTGLSDLLRDDVKVVMATEGAAIGKAGKAILQSAGLWDRLEERRRGGGNLVSTVGTVNKVVESVSTMEGYIGLAWDAVAQQFADVVMVPLPANHERIEYYEIGVLVKSANPTAALRFARYVTARDKGLTLAQKHHFHVVPGDKWAETPRIHVSAGAMLEPALRDIVKTFTEREGVHIDTTYLGCGLLVSQMRAIKAGDSPRRFPDAYVSCDVAFTEMVKDDFEAGTIITQNDLVLIVPKGNRRNIQSLADLKRPDVKRIGLPHPENSALGARIVTLLEKLEFPETAYRAVLRDGTPNPRVHHADAAHLLVAQIKSLDAAIVARSNALSNPSNPATHLDIIELNGDVSRDEGRVTQMFSIAKDSDHKHLLQRFLAAVTSAAGQKRLRALGFQPVEPRMP
jgi:molybdate transport system substrate-binding protein